MNYVIADLLGEIALEYVLGNGSYDCCLADNTKRRKEWKTRKGAQNALDRIKSFSSTIARGLTVYSIEELENIHHNHKNDAFRI